MKAMVDLHIVITGKIQEDGLRELLKKLYAKTSKERGFKYHTNPTFVFISAYSDKERAESRSGGWVAMLRKTVYDRKPDIQVNSKLLAIIKAEPVKRFGLTEDQRRAVYVELILAERKATKGAEAKYPLGQEGVDLKEHMALMYKLNEQYRATIAKKYSLTEDQLFKIGGEGFEAQWPSPSPD